MNRGCMWVPGVVRYYFILLQKQEYICTDASEFASVV